MESDGEKEEEGHIAEEGPAKKKQRNIQEESDLSDKDFTVRNILQTITDVKSWRELGLQLGLKSPKLNAIEEEESTAENRKIKMIEEWMKLGEDKANWDILQNALTAPALCENVVAQSLAKRRGSSFDSKSIRYSQSVASTTNSDEEFTEAKVRNMIEHFHHILDLGQKIGLPPSKLDEISELPLEKQKLQFVETLFRVDSDCNWTRLIAAMKEVDTMIWARKHSWQQKKGSSSLGSYSEGMFSPAHSLTSIVSEVDETDLQRDSVAKRNNTATIKKNYAKLIMKITTNLSKVDLDMDEFYTFVMNILDDKNIPRADNVKEVFKTLTSNRCWNFLDISSLESIVEEFSKEFEEQNRKLIKEYKEALTGFKTATKIVDYMSENKEKTNNLEDDSDDEEEAETLVSQKSKYDKKYRKELSVKLYGKHESKITLKSLEYIEKFWTSLCDEFDMPSLPKLLDSIVYGSIVITWLVRRIHAQKILNNIHHTLDFLKKEFILEISLESVCIYNEDSGVATAEVIKYTRLLMTEQEGKLQEDKAILGDYFPDINTTLNQEGRSVLTMAAQCGHKSLLEFLLNNGADAFHIDAGGENVLGLSSSHQDLNEWLKTTLDDKMISSAKDGDLKTVLKAFKCGIHPDAREHDQYAWTALHWASDKGHLDVVDHLLNCGAEPNAEDKSSWTSLILASRNGHLKVVKRLLNAGADPNQTKKTTWTPLTWAAECNHLEITKLLLESGANPNIYDKLGLSPLYQAAQNGHKDVVKALVEESKFEIEINHTTELAWSALFVAVKNGYEEIVEYLVEKGADVSYQKRDNTAALHLACFKENFFMTKLLIKKKANVNVQDTDGLTPLMFAASHGQLKLVRLLVEDGRADLNMAENMNQWTAVFFAMQAKHHDVMKYLLDTKRIELNHKDGKGNTLFGLAETVNPEAFQYLKENFKEDEKLADQERTAAGLPKLTPKILMGETGSPYFASMIEKIHSKGIAGGAA